MFFNLKNDSKYFVEIRKCLLSLKVKSLTSWTEINNDKPVQF